MNEERILVLEEENLHLRNTIQELLNSNKGMMELLTLQTQNMNLILQNQLRTPQQQPFLVSQENEKTEEEEDKENEEIEEFLSEAVSFSGEEVASWESPEEFIEAEVNAGS